MCACFLFQTLIKKLKELKGATHDLQFRLDEHTERPRAIASMLQSLNISNVFFDSLKGMAHVKDIYTEKDLKDLDQIRNETKVRGMQLRGLFFRKPGNNTLRKK